MGWFQDNQWSMPLRIMVLVAIADASFVFIQLAKTLQEGAVGVSPLAYGVLSITSLLWILWGVKQQDLPITIGAVLTFLGSVAIQVNIICCRYED